MESVIERATTPTKARKVIQNFSRGQDALKLLYGETMERICALPTGRSELAMKTLRWISLSHRHLTAQELTHALAIDVENDTNDERTTGDIESRSPSDLPDFDRDDVPDIKLVLSSCLGLVVIEGQDHTVSFSHYTVYEFFKSQDDWVSNGHTMLGKACIRYLSSADLVACNDETRMNYPLRYYAVECLGLHVRLSGSKACMKAAFAFMTDNRRVSLVGALIELDRYSGPRGYSDVTGVHLAAYYGLTELLEDLLLSGQSIDALTEERFTPLAWAVNKGQTTCVTKLLDLGAIITHQDVEYDYH